MAKKVLAAVACVIIVLSVLIIPASAATKTDLWNEVKNSNFSGYLIVQFENAFRTVPVSDAQATQILPLIQDAKQRLSNKGHSLHLYPMADRDYVLGQCVKVCNILGFTYDIVPSAHPKHQGDIVFVAYDANQNVVFEIDGDIVSWTDGARQGVDYTLLYLSVGLAVLALGTGGFIVLRNFKKTGKAAQ